MGKEKESGGDLGPLGSEARKYVWMGAIPLLINLHSSEVTSLPVPSPVLVLAPRNGYLPLLVDSIKPHFQSSLPPGSDTIWFEYERLPLKWHIPTGVLFDLLCAEPERPWNLTVHFRAYPSEVLSPCEGEDAVKWNFINAMKEASYVMYGSTKSVMNMSQLDQVALWKSVVKGDLENFDHIFTRVRPGSSSNFGRPALSRPSNEEIKLETSSAAKLGNEGVLPGRIPMRLYIRRLKEKVNDLYDVPPVDSWDELVYMSRPIDFPRDEGLVMTLGDALMKVVPHLFSSALPAVVVDRAVHTENSHEIELDYLRTPRSYSDVARASLGEEVVKDVVDSPKTVTQPETGDLVIPSKEGLEEEVHKNVKDLCHESSSRVSGGQGKKVRLISSGGLWEDLQLGSAKQFNGVVRIQGIEPNLDIPLDWVARNLCGPEQLLHLSICTWFTP